MLKPDLSIIIVSYNTKKTTEDCVKSIYQSLKDSNIKYELIVIDNASTDGSFEMLESFAESKPDSFKLIKNKSNLGFARANNLGVKEAMGSYILFLNSDIIVLDNAIEKMFKFYQQNQKTINFLGGKLLNKDMSPQPSAAPFYTLPIVFAALFLKGDYWGLTRSSPSSLTKVDWVSGACILTTKEYFNKINGFDEKIFMYMDEVDLLYRAKMSGMTTYFYPEACFIHLGSASSSGRTYPITQVFSGLIYFYKKHCSKSALFLLKILLKLKLTIAVLIGRITNNRYLIETYEKADQIVKMAW